MGKLSNKDRWLGKTEEQEARKGRLDPTDVVAMDFVTTLSTREGYSIAEFKGIVTSVGTFAGKNIQTRGERAMDSAMLEIRRAAHHRGANAILGLQIASFAESDGIGSGLLGDRVGVCLTGTAVVVEAKE